MMVADAFGTRLFCRIASAMDLHRNSCRALRDPTMRDWRSRRGRELRSQTLKSLTDLGSCRLASKGRSSIRFVHPGPWWQSLPGRSSSPEPSGTHCVMGVLLSAPAIGCTFYFRVLVNRPEVLSSSRGRQSAFRSAVRREMHSAPFGPTQTSTAVGPIQDKPHCPLTPRRSRRCSAILEQIMRAGSFSYSILPPFGHRYRCSRRLR
jgi:hypothetical protein